MHYFETDLFRTRQLTNERESHLRRLTAGEAAEQLQLKVYDTALPQTWVDQVKQLTGWYPAGDGIVWCYDRSTNLGEPVALTTSAQQKLGIALHTMRRC